MTDFVSLGLAEPLTRALAEEGYTTPTPIQAQAIPHLLQGRDLMGLAQTGTGKTAAFALPILQKLAADKTRPARKSCRALILTPTRELAAQIADSFATYGRHVRLSRTVIFGGVGQRPQENAVANGVDIVVATPGRLLDLMNQGHLTLASLQVFVLDEADRMLDMGFINDIRRILRALPPVRQSLFFSATMPDEAAKLADTMLKEPVRVAVTPVSSTVERISQSVMFVDQHAKRVLLEKVLREPGVERTLVFTRMKHVANRVAEHLVKAGIEAAAIHGNKSQSARTAALEGFRRGTVKALVATDIAARGIDVDGVTHVVNYDLPNVPESYVHRIGRTARAGAEGVAIAFCAPDERAFLRDIERLIRRQVPVVPTPELGPIPAPEPDRPPMPHRGGGGRGQPARVWQHRQGQGRPQQARRAGGR